MIITVFRSRLSPEAVEEYGTTSVRMIELATSMPGFVSVKAFVADDGERCTIVEFDSWEHHDAWAQHVEHRSAQARGREAFYTTFDLKVGEVQRHSSFPATGEQDSTR